MMMKHIRERLHLFCARHFYFIWKWFIDDTIPPRDPKHK